MRKTLSQVGNSRALILDRTMLDLLGVGERGEVELQIQGDTLLVRPAASTARRERLATIGAEILDRYQDAFARLAKPD
jgi:antitoxin component of MazEF toxin-antitoxin module